MVFRIGFLHLIPVHVILISDGILFLTVPLCHGRKQLVKAVIGIGRLRASLSLLRPVPGFIVFVGDRFFFISVLMVGDFRLCKLP